MSGALNVGGEWRPICHAEGFVSWSFRSDRNSSFGNWFLPSGVAAQTAIQRLEPS
jgi:hypothetical protein